VTNKHRCLLCSSLSGRERHPSPWPPGYPVSSSTLPRGRHASRSSSTVLTPSSTRCGALQAWLRTRCCGGAAPPGPHASAGCHSVDNCRVPTYVAAVNCACKRGCAVVLRASRTTHVDSYVAPHTDVSACTSVDTCLVAGHRCAWTTMYSKCAVLRMLAGCRVVNTCCLHNQWLMPAAEHLGWAGARQLLSRYLARVELVIGPEM
jgi:hypothetical protein